MHKDLTSIVSPISSISPARKAGKHPLPRSQFKLAVLAATLTAGMLMSLPGHAFNLGNLSTLSALGEPLRLEFEVLDLSPAEVESFRVTLESPQSYAARGLGYGPALEGMRLGLIRNAAGRLMIRMEGQRPATESFVDLLLNISWASGSTIRSVSVLLTPPPGIAAAELPRAAAGAEPVALAPAAPMAAAPASEPSPAAVQPNLAAVPVSGSEAAPVQSVTSAAKSIVAKPGDTAGALAQGVRPAGVDQSQYLLALVQTNPSAFVEGNVNRLVAGAQLQLPTEAQAKVTSAREARQTIAAQWQEFQALRQQIAAKQPALAPSASIAPGAQAQGQVDSLPGAASAPNPADKLTLSKPATVGDGRAEQALLEEREANDAKARLEELTRTATELTQLQASAGSANPAVTAPGTSAVIAPTGNALSGDAPLSTVTMPAPTSQAATGTGLVDRLADHPAVLPAAGGSLAMALAWLGWRLRRKSPPHEDELEGDFAAPALASEEAAAPPLPPANLASGAETISMLPTRSTLEHLQTEAAPNKNAETELDLDLELDLDEEPAASNASSLTAQTLARAKEASSL